MGMITVTEEAMQYLKKLLLAHTNDPEAGVRLIGRSGKLGVVLDKAAEGDQVIEHEGFKVLLVEQELAGILDEATLDVQDTPDGTGLVVSKE